MEPGEFEVMSLICGHCDGRGWIPTPAGEHVAAEFMKLYFGLEEPEPDTLETDERNL